ncbi:MAG: TlpA family protein disulfide reductase [Polyangiaceae bacterium]|nr:TlpA family protein disulfide reductase [Polyangiaceae bacterium]
MPPSAPHQLAGRPLPAFARPALSGARFDLAATRGQVTIVKFFARYCEPCKRTLPAVQRLHTELPEVALVGISEDESEEDARALVAAYGLAFPVVLDRGNVLAGRYRVTDLPVTFVADRAGNLAWVGGPDQSEADLEAAVRSLL